MLLKQRAVKKLLNIPHIPPSLEQDNMNSGVSFSHVARDSIAAVKREHDLKQLGQVPRDKQVLKRRAGSKN